MFTNAKTILAHTLKFSVLSLAVAATTPSYAAPIHDNYTGANCLPQHEDYNIRRHFNGTMSNESTAVDHIWECPVTDRATKTLSIVRVKVFDYGPNSSASFVCSLKSVNASAGVVETENQTTNGFGHDELVWQGSDLVNTNGTSSLSLRCRVPRKGNNTSGVIYYSVVWN